jgi:hypothetical protein
MKFILEYTLPQNWFSAQCTAVCVARREAVRAGHPWPMATVAQTNAVINNHYAAAHVMSHQSVLDAMPEDTNKVQTVVDFPIPCSPTPTT